MPDSLVAKWLARSLAAASLVTVGDSSSSTTDTGGLPTEVGTTTTTTEPAPETGTGLKPMKLGVNLATPNYYNHSRQFMNLAVTHVWKIYASAGDPSTYFDADGNVIRFETGDKISRLIQLPDGVFAGKTVDIVCRWDGTGTLAVANTSNVANVVNKANESRFTFIAASSTARMDLKGVSSGDPIRNIDCREAGADPNKLFADNFLAMARRFNTLRFVNWQNTIYNEPVTWATRSRPVGPGKSNGPDGFPIEYMIALTDQADSDPWFCMPWNADDDYIRKFAEMVRDKVDPKRKIYVEMSNEVWNWGFAATKQARDEGLAEGLSTNEFNAVLYRYAEKLSHAMDIWKDVFAGQEGRLVRVLASQNNLANVTKVLTFRDTASKIDAISTAPYFGYNLDTTPPDLTDLSAFFTTLKDKIDSVYTESARIKALADQYGKRYVTYEAGQHVTGKDVAAQEIIQHDPRMGQLYNYYLQQWQSRFGDVMNHFSDYGVISTSGAWGLLEDPSQAPDATVKSKAVWLFQASITK